MTCVSSIAAAGRGGLRLPNISFDMTSFAAALHT